MVNRILERRGFGNQRINQYWLSGAESEKLVKSVEDAVEKVQRMGKNPIHDIKSKKKKASIAS